MPVNEYRAVADVLNRSILNTSGNGTFEDTRLPRLIGRKDAGEFIGRVEATPEKEPGDICVPDMIVTLLHNYDPEVLRAFLDRQRGDIKFSREGPGDNYFFILKGEENPLGSYIAGRHIL